MKLTVGRIERMKDSSAGMRNSKRLKRQTLGCGRCRRLLTPTLMLTACLVISSHGPALAANWGPYDMTTSGTIYNNGFNGSLRTGYYSSNAGRSILKAGDAYMLTMPAASLVTGSSFSIAFMRSGTYSSTASSSVNIYRITTAWTSANWTDPWTNDGVHLPLWCPV